MNQEIIKQYIQFAIDNGFNMKKYILEDGQVKKWKARGFEATATISDIELITSKEFIEAVARGLNKNDIAPYGIGEITIKQSLAIRDNKLSEFITNLLKNEN